jgi:hypothetical protein
MEEQVNEIIEAGDRVEKLLKTKDWKNYIDPLIDKMIMDTLGGSFSGEYVLASENLKTMTEGELKYNLGFAEGLITFRRRVNQYIVDRDSEIDVVISKNTQPTDEELSRSDYDTLS